MYSMHSVKDEKKNCFPSAKHDLILGGCVSLKGVLSPQAWLTEKTFENDRRQYQRPL